MTTRKARLAEKNAQKTARAKQATTVASVKDEKQVHEDLDAKIKPCEQEIKATRSEIQKLNAQADLAGLKWVEPRDRRAHFIGPDSSAFNQKHSQLIQKLKQAQGRLQMYLDRKDPKKAEERKKQVIHDKLETQYWDALAYSTGPPGMDRLARDLYFLFPNHKAENQVLAQDDFQETYSGLALRAMFSSETIYPMTTTRDLQLRAIRHRRLVPLLPLDELKQLMDVAKMYQDGRRSKELDLFLAKIEIDRPARRRKRAADLEAGREIIEPRAVGSITMFVDGKQQEKKLLCGTRCYHFSKSTAMIRCDCEGKSNLQEENFREKMPVPSQRAQAGIEATTVVLDLYHYEMQQALTRICGSIQSWGDVNELLSCSF